MKARVHALVVVAACMVAGCSDKPTAPRAIGKDANGLSMSRGAERNAAQRKALLTDVPVTGTLADGGSFTGTLTAKHLSVDPVTRQITVDGVVNGTALKATGEAIDVVAQAFTTVASLNRPGVASSSSVVQPVQGVTCGILHLDLGPLNLNLLGLTVDLSEVILDVNAVTGAGNLLGNLLCALVGILDIPGALASITHILDLINNLLSGLTNPGVGGVMWIAPSNGMRLYSA